MGLISKPIFARLAKRFQVRQTTVEQLETGNTLVPVTIADDLLKTVVFAGQAEVATDATHTFPVPAGKTWTLQAVSMNRDNAAAMRISAGESEYRVRLATGAATDTVASWTGSLLLKQNQVVEAVYSTGVSGDLVTTITYIEEDDY